MPTHMTIFKFPE